MRKLLWNLMVLLMVGTVARAELLVYEGFNYTAGDISGLTATGTGLSGTWAVVNGGTTNTVNATSLTYPTSSTLTPTGGTFYKNASTANISTATVSMSTINFDSDGTYYLSFLVRQNSLGGINYGQGLAWLELKNATQTSVYAGQVILGITNNRTSMGAIGSATAFPAGDQNMSDGEQVYMVTAKITTVASGNDTLNVQVYTTNPSSTEPETWSLNLSSAVTGVANQLSLMTHKLANPCYFDEIRVGTTWEDVVGTQIPEPATMLLSAGALSSLLLRKKK